MSFVICVMLRVSIIVCGSVTSVYKESRIMDYEVQVESCSCFNVLYDFPFFVVSDFSVYS